MRVTVTTWLAAGALLLVGCGAEDDVPDAAATTLVTTAPVTTSPATTSPATTSPMTTSPVTTSPVTTSPVTTSPATTAPPGPWDGAWRAVAGTVDGEAVDLVGDITLTVEGTTFSGSAACNSYELDAIVTGDTAEFVDGFVTEIGCEPPLTELEQTYLRSIGPIATLAVDGGTLTLQGPSATWTFERVPEVPDTPLTGTRWVVYSVVNEYGGMFPLYGTVAFVVLSPDGTLTGSTGCAPIEGSWAEQDGRVVLDAPADGVCVGDEAEVSEAMRRLLADGFEPRVDGDRLTAVIDAANSIEFIPG